MIIGIGTDLVSVRRIGKKLEKDAFKELVFSIAEITYCEKNKHPQEHFAGKFAAKEALIKALGNSLFSHIQLHEIEVLNEESGQPFFRLKDGILGEKRVLLTISHTDKYATATVVIES